MEIKNNCVCQSDVSNVKLIHKTTYSKFGWFLLTILGLSAKPKRVDFTCPNCKKIVSSTSDPKILAQYIGR